MRPNILNEPQGLMMARVHADELREDWRKANASGVKSTRRPDRGGPSLLAQLRLGTARRLIGLGSRLMPEQSEPCA